ncbi:MAG: hypothetical protein U0L97_00815 [Candidatus Saccharimonadaceae bacterium]|nr:hypothetical protein [Candidatus Saccharimonadaceae bacterium]
MAKCYNRRILSDALADLGKAIGGVPRQKDLTSEMASRSTYIRYFGDWKTALEYAGFVDEPVQEEHEEDLIADDCNVTSKIPEIKLVNLCGKPIVFLDGSGESDVIPSVGRAYACMSNPVQPVAAKALSAIINDVPVVTARLKRIVVYPEGSSNERKFPAPVENTFYIVSEVVARNIYRFGRSALDLLYPQRKYMANGIMYIETLGMVYTKNLPICARS